MSSARHDIVPSCIKLFPSCNRGPGDVTVSQTFASVCMYLVGYKGSTDLSTHMTNSSVINSVSSIPTIPTQQPLDVPTDAQGSNSVSDSATHVMNSQPLPRRVAEIRRDERASSSQPVDGGHILNSPRRMRSGGLFNRYQMSYRRQGFEVT